MQYILGFLLGIIGVLFLQSRRSEPLPEKKEELDQATKKIESNKDAIKKEEEKLNAPVKEKSKTLTELASYFNRTRKK